MFFVLYSCVSVLGYQVDWLYSLVCFCVCFLCVLVFFSEVFLVRVDEFLAAGCV